MNETQSITTSYGSIIDHRQQDAPGQKEHVAHASREGAEPEIRVNSRRRLTPEMLESSIVQPVLSEDHAERVAAMDAKLLNRGIAVDRDKVLSLGKALFSDLLVADREARAESRVFGAHTDFSKWDSVYFGLTRAGAADSLGIPRRSTGDQFAGRGRELEEAKDISSGRDAWKCTLEGRAVKAYFAFDDLFKTLCFGHSMLGRIEDDGRIRSRFFAGGGSGEKARYFETTWLPALKGVHHRIQLRNTLASVACWLAGERPPVARDLAKRWCGVRSPNEDQEHLAQAVLDGFLLNYSGWKIWDYVGARCRRKFDQFTLAAWHRDLREQLPNVSLFHRETSAYFFRPLVGDHEGNFEFEPARHRRFVAGTFAMLRQVVSEVAALTIDENHPADGSPPARFLESILCTGKPKPEIVERVVEKLATAFNGGAFDVEAEAL